MFRRLLLIGILFSVRLAAAQDIDSAPDCLANAQLQVTALPDLLNADSTQTDLGDLRMRIDADNKQLLYQYNEMPIQSIPLPETLRDGLLTIAPNGLAAVICDPENGRDFVAPGTEYTVNLDQHQITKSGMCDYFTDRTSNLPNPLSWETESPDGKYRVYAQEEAPLCNYYDHIPVFIQSDTDQRTVVCIPRRLITIEVDFVRWLDNDRLLLRTYSPLASDAPIEESMILSVGAGKVTSLGDEVAFYPSGLFFGSCSE